MAARLVARVTSRGAGADRLGVLEWPPSPTAFANCLRLPLLAATHGSSAPLPVSPNRHLSGSTASSESASSASQATAASQAQDLAQRQRDYLAQVSALRKSYSKEQQELRRAALKVQQARREAAASEKESHAEEKRAAREARAARAREDQERLRAAKQELKVMNAARLKEREEKIAAHKEADQNALRMESSRWIREDELEWRIMEAMSKPYIL
ncbi:hypothetical protein CLOM_g6592 [Closterium sp. NIES-68]|nr:hypothetical protein CLOM_g9299 [Closterium sp. NIES-68]GJP47401.1 hypothetical protein CLOM_g6592 [Closterium sp. NIES-68]GJP69580.1 hypothetical protein CLOP_g579 [Closterium sp. NIES-67]